MRPKAQSSNHNEWVYSRLADAETLPSSAEGFSMAFHPLLHPVFESLRFGRILFVEISPAPPAGRRCRYCDVFMPENRDAERSHFSAADAAVRSILAALERGAAVESVVFGGAGDPLRHRGVGSILRQLRQSAHVGTIVLSDGRLLADRQVRREAGESGTVVVWLPAIDERDADSTRALARRDAFGRRVEAIASLRRETPTEVVLELPVRSTTTSVALDAWKKAAQRIRPARVLAVASRADAGDPAALERVKAAIHRKAGAYLDDDTIADRRCFCDTDPSPPIVEPA